MAVVEADEHRRTGGRGFIAADEVFAGFDDAERAAGGHAERFEHFGGEDFAHRALQREAAIAGAAVRRGAGALGAQVHQAARHVPALREQETAAIAQIGVVGAELVAVIAQGERLGQAAGEGDEAAEMACPLRVGQAIKAHLGGGAIIAEPEDGLRHGGRSDRIEEIRAE